MCNSLFADKGASVAWFSKRTYTVCIVQCIMHRTPTKHLSPLRDIRNEKRFDADVLDQIVKAKTSFFNKICREIHIERHDKIK